MVARRSCAADCLCTLLVVFGVVLLNSTSVGVSGSQDDPQTAAREPQESLFWQTIMNSDDPADYEAYLEAFPDGLFARLAANRLEALRASTGDARSVTPGTVFRDCALCPELVVIPAGRYRMGCVSGTDCEDDEFPVHEVQVQAFALGRYEVTFSEYDRFADATGRPRADDEGWGRGRRPVINVSWDDAVSYAYWLSSETGAPYRLPSEAEWEYAARAGTATGYSWGSQPGRNRANCRRCGSRWDFDETAPVGSFASSIWGLHDLHGNVWEWVADCWHPSYQGAPGDGSAWIHGADCGRRVFRSGSWAHDPPNMRSSNRVGTQTHGRNTTGFRVARALN